MSSMRLQMSFELQAKHAQRRMLRQHRIELTDGNLGRPRRQARKGIIGRRQAAGRLDKSEMAQSGACRCVHVQQLRQRADRHRHRAGQRSLYQRWWCSGQGRLDRTLRSLRRRRCNGLDGSAVGRPPSQTKRQTGPPRWFGRYERHRHCLGCGVHVDGGIDQRGPQTIRASRRQAKVRVRPAPRMLHIDSALRYRRP